jgi:hypothetical protein
MKRSPVPTIFTCREMCICRRRTKGDRNCTTAIKKIAFDCFYLQIGNKARERGRRIRCVRYAAHFSPVQCAAFSEVITRWQQKKHDYYLIRGRVLWSCIARRPRLNNGARRDLKFTSAESPFWETALAERLRLYVCREMHLAKHAAQTYSAAAFWLISIVEGRGCFSWRAQWGPALIK